MHLSSIKCYLNGYGHTLFLHTYIGEHLACLDYTEYNSYQEIEDDKLVHLQCKVIIFIGKVMSILLTSKFYNVLKFVQLYVLYPLSRKKKTNA